MVVVHRERCTGCGTCLKICHEPCLELVGGKVRLQRTALSLESAQCALANMYFTAQVMGVASCLFGPGRIVLDRSRSARRRLGLGAHERILGTLLLGWPAVSFRNCVRGKTLPLRWV